MRIGIFSKIGASGGSEHRVAELANSIHRYTPHDTVIFCEKDINPKIAERVDPGVPICRNMFKGDSPDPTEMYNVDSLLVVNSDSYSFSKLDYWEGKTDHHDFHFDLTQIPQMIFLYNFVISPSQNLVGLQKYVDDVRIITTSKDFFNQIQNKQKFKLVRGLPLMVLESPIDPNSISQYKTPSDKVRIGKHSKSIGYKFDEENLVYISEVNKTHGDKIAWDFLGVPGDRVHDIIDIENVTVRTEYTVPVKEYLTGIDIFSFFISWDRSEPWSRSVAEGMMSGCPILATNKAGNVEQVTHSHNGFLCDDIHDFITYTRLLIDHSELREMMGYRSYKQSLGFTSEKVINKFLHFLESKKS